MKSVKSVILHPDSLARALPELERLCIVLGTVRMEIAYHGLHGYHVPATEAAAGPRRDMGSNPYARAPAERHGSHFFTIPLPVSR